MSYLYLADTLDPFADYSVSLAFEYRGHGDALLDNSFVLHAPGVPGAVSFMWTNGQDPFHNSENPWTTYTDPSGNAFAWPGVAAGRVIVSLPVNSFVPFDYLGSAGAYALCNDPSPVHGTCGSTSPQGQHFALAIDGAPFATEGQSAWIGLSDLPGPDHDEQDLSVRVSVVPEPATLALLGTGLLSLALRRRKR
jgi:hypothetical protein